MKIKNYTSAIITNSLETSGFISSVLHKTGLFKNKIFDNEYDLIKYCFTEQPDILIIDSQLKNLRPDRMKSILTKVCENDIKILFLCKQSLVHEYPCLQTEYALVKPFSAEMLKEKMKSFLDLSFYSKVA